MADGSVISFSDGSVIAGVKHDDVALPASTVLCSIVSGRAGDLWWQPKLGYAWMAKYLESFKSYGISLTDARNGNVS